MTDKLTAAQQYHKALHAMPSAIKFNATVSYGTTKFKYVDFKALRGAVLPILAEHGLSVRYTTAAYGEALLLIGEIAHENGEIVNSFGLPLRENIKPQDLGSEITYYKRYALAALCGVVGDQDDDGNFAEKAEVARGNKKEKLKGPLQRTALNTQIKGFVTALLRSTSIEEYDSAVEEYKSVIKQARDELPELLTEKGPENYPSVDEQAKKKLHSLKSEEEMFKQQQKDLGEGSKEDPFGFKNPMP